MRRQEFALNDIFSETTRPEALIFTMKHCPVDLHQVYSNGHPGVQNGLAVGKEGVMGIKYS